MTAQSWLAASGEPVADLNQVLVDASSHATDQLRTFHQTLQVSSLPALYFLTPAVADQLAPTATALGLTLVGTTPVMVCAAADLPTVDAGHTLVQQVVTADQQESVCTILADAFALPHAALKRVLDITQLAAPGFTAYLACDTLPGLKSGSFSCDQQRATHRSRRINQASVRGFTLSR